MAARERLDTHASIDRLIETLNEVLDLGIHRLVKGKTTVQDVSIA
jgi:hypothetical protein